MTTTNEKRDPRVDPKLGDALRRGRRTLTVTAIQGGRVIGTSTHPLYYPIKFNSDIGHWRGLRKNAEIIHAAE